MDLETQLRRVLEERSTTSPSATDVVGAVHAGMTRRRRRQRLGQGAVALSVVAIAVSSALVLRPVPTEAPATANVVVDVTAPTGFEVDDLTWTSTTHGYALGTAPCDSGPACTFVLRTDTGSKDWVDHGILPAAVSPSAGPCPAANCVTHLRFAKDADGNEIGYAFGPSFAVTHDAGVAWTTQPTAGVVEALEAARAGNVVRVVSRPGGGHLVQQATVGLEDWKQVDEITAVTPSVILKRQADRLVLLTFHNNTVRSETNVSDLRYSRDGGTTWTKGAHNPCDTDSALVGASLGRQGQVLVLCSRRTDGTSYVRESKDDGTTFGKPIALPRPLRATQLVALNHRWLVAGDVAGKHERVVMSSPDSGTTWDQVVSQDAPGSTESTGYLDNSNSKTVWWLGPDPRVVWKSTDSGDTWSSATFRS